MSFQLRWTAQATETFEQLHNAAQQAARTRARANTQSRGKQKTKSSKHEGLFKQAAKAVSQLAANPRHPSLATHEYHSLEHPFDPKAKVFEAYAQNKTPGAYRIFWCYGPSKTDITIIAITPHP
jgi:hypothetical protein